MNLGMSIRCGMSKLPSTFYSSKSNETRIKESSLLSIEMGDHRFAATKLRSLPYRLLKTQLLADDRDTGKRRPVAGSRLPRSW